jgi:uncharacterized membrane protein
MLLILRDLLLTSAYDTIAPDDELKKKRVTKALNNIKYLLISTFCGYVFVLLAVLLGLNLPPMYTYTFIVGFVVVIIFACIVIYHPKS